MFKFKVGDQVQVTAGRDKGIKGKVEKVLVFENKLVVAGANIYKRHKKVTRTKASGIYEITRPIPVSKVALICPKCAQTTRVGFVKEGKIKNRICKKCQGRLV
ncbi:50S ribosomal protein L24 [Candidatus Curtissbacteria bacterium RIFCSPHIGHO2_01_FULL_41_44]|uniref:Large ribosomal subunit protein uL24 n=1 Tax=Candidatus Curtissbacteria bacterium RIFCSPLOWO2_01_FULL_42_50 TaxID=1797730 RepID=A0A1F5H2N8_9BACT|nr:MAG: 50S ribosomal protein L24 [Candidatus Curtissbacteria bacterium RIFCSPHIGHO2_02_FULL_42_58]OGD94761.1 MAG: 50S ribosomal protein L24 [Candidatus Curtissbacteria bacterium RIFCSPHIGHO2_01_FULL_41_44]OGD96305.1 MAG: 50S ribosomal protein L24 [Candidatus Curtissbacteria bacterium RIFCSPHIGHO2_12_FULL_42_33]OGD98324.1 MAG: 50S ribosomal protein L24 [Candidatus Curtissbacteria bacterium RIFCSPLOWO2_01_FULL_42_50]OGE02961.1 MAG: 50S ribosomal protein L24 [Candidatus Curtissbacteria bacterium 